MRRGGIAPARGSHEKRGRTAPSLQCSPRHVHLPIDHEFPLLAARPPVQLSRRKLRHADVDGGRFAIAHKPRRRQSGPGEHPAQQAPPFETSRFGDPFNAPPEAARVNGDPARGIVEIKIRKMLAKSNPRSPATPFGSIGSQPRAPKIQHIAIVQVAVQHGHVARRVHQGIRRPRTPDRPPMRRPIGSTRNAARTTTAPRTWPRT